MISMKLTSHSTMYIFLSFDNFEFFTIETLIFLDLGQPPDTRDLISARKFRMHRVHWHILQTMGS